VANYWASDPDIMASPSAGRHGRHLDPYGKDESSRGADIITASMTLNGARDQVIDARTSYHQARVALASAPGMTAMIQ
jgi:hypothetical protein